MQIKSGILTLGAEQCETRLQVSRSLTSMPNAHVNTHTHTHTHSFSFPGTTLVNATSAGEEVQGRTFQLTHQKNINDNRHVNVGIPPTIKSRSFHAVKVRVDWLFIRSLSPTRYNQGLGNWILCGFHGSCRHTKLEC